MTEVKLPLKILGTGIFLPNDPILSSEIDKRMGLEKGTIEDALKIKQRYFAKSITATEMGAAACQVALNNAGYTCDDIDLIISATAVAEQPIPSQASLIHEALRLKKTAAFDINATCLSFIQAFMTVASYFKAGLYERALIVSCEKSSAGLDWNKVDVGGNFGDGASAVLVEATKDNCGIIAHDFETWSEGARLCEIRGGGTLIDPKLEPARYASEAMFRMDGPAIYKLAFRKYPKFLKALFEKAQYTIDDIHKVVPHQASAGALMHISRALKVPKDKIINIFETHGNQIAASIPTALHYALQGANKNKSQDLLITGTAAGFSLSGMIIRV